MEFFSSVQETKNKQPLPVRVWNKLRDPKGLARLAWHALVHTWHGFRLFWLEARLSAKYVSKLARGQPLLRKERQQVDCYWHSLWLLVTHSLFSP